jgi:Putative Ig domain
MVNTAYTQTLAATGGTAPYTWTLAAGTLPAGLALSGAGVLSGTPTTQGTSNFTIRVTDNASQTVTNAFVLTINPPVLSITTASLLPPGVAATSYPQQTLAATGGAAPYTWSVAQGSSLPPGLTLSSSGVLSGTLAAAGTFHFTVRVSDSFTQPQNAQKELTLVVSPASLTITTSTFPIGIVNSPFAQQLQAIGGTTPYTWSLFSGTLPAGLTLSAAGIVSGTPTTAGTQDFVIRVADSAGTTSTRSFSLLVQPAGVGSFPAISANLPATGNPTQQLSMSLNVSPASPNPLTIQLKMSFNSTAAIPVDDPMTQFSNGLRSVNLIIPANTTSFQVPVLLLLGTVSGTAQLAVDIESGPSNVPVGSISILPAAPQMTSISAVRRNGGLQLQISGYSTTRRITAAEFIFDVRMGTASERVTLQRSVESDFMNWYQSPGSAAFGSGFLYMQEFKVDATTVVDSVSIRLINEQGTGSADSVPITN